MQPRFDSRQGNAETLRIGLLRHALQITEENGLAVERRKFGEDSGDALAQRINRKQIGFHFCGEIVRQRDLRLGQTQSVDQQIARHMKKPGTRIVDPAEITVLLQGPQKNFLQQVVGVTPMAGTVQQKMPELALVRSPRTIKASGR